MASRDGNAECASHKEPGRGNFILVHHDWIVAHLEERGSAHDTEVNLEAGDALGGAKWTWRRRGLGGEKHTRRTRE
jgi:hypothetical protein